ncbi:cation:proton antiporter [Chloroflexota bacterium]
MAEMLIAILVVMLFARFAGELMERVGQLAILGELLAGISLGLLITYGPFSQFSGLAENEVFKAISSLGMLFLMLMVGMEMDVRELVKASKASIAVALGGIILPLGLGYTLGLVFLPESEYKVIQCFFLGVALSITAIPALSRILIDLRQLNTRLGNTIIGAAITDDVLGLILLAILTTMMLKGGVPSAGELALLIAKVAGFFVVVIITGRFLMLPMCRKFHQLKSKEIEFSIAVIIALAFGIAAEYAGMHFIVGALVTGMLFREGRNEADIVADINSKVTGIALGFLAPIFFVSIGLHVDFSALSTAPLFVLAMLAVAIAGKMIGCGIPAKLAGFSSRESIAIGIGMNGRGAVEIAVAAVALEAGLFAQPVPTPPLVTAIFSSIIIMAIVTTLIVPIGMKPFLRG